MAAQQNSFADLAGLARRGQDTAADAFQLWTSTVRSGSESVKHMRRLVDDLFSLADHSIVAGREYNDHMSTVLRISAAGIDTWRGLTNISFNALQSATEWAASASR